MSSPALLIPFAWSEAHGRMVEPLEVEKGERCGCVCPGCRRAVLARQGSRNRAHFAHAGEAPCVNGFETSLHRAAKQVIETERKLWLPAAIAFPLYPDNMQAVRAAASQLLAVDRVEIETNVGQIRPDLIVWRRNRPLAVEIEVTHPVSDQKAETYRRERLSALAINLKKIARSVSFAALRAQLLAPSREVRWVHNDFVDSLTDKFRGEAVTRPLTWRTSHKRAGKIPHVDDCPCPPRIAKAHGSTFANAKLDCPACPYYLPQVNLRKIYSVRCAGHLASRFPAAIHEDWVGPDMAD